MNDFTDPSNLGRKEKVSHMQFFKQALTPFTRLVDALATKWKPFFASVGAIAIGFAGMKISEAVGKDVIAGLFAILALLGSIATGILCLWALGR